MVDSVPASFKRCRDARGGHALSQQPTDAAEARRKRSIAAIIGVAAGLIVVMLFVAAVVSRTRGGGGGPGTDGAPPFTGARGTGSGPVGDRDVPGTGSDTHLAGGLALVPVPEGWTLVTRGDRQENLGGYAEAAVIRHEGTGVVLAAYVRGDTNEGNRAIALAEEGAREWTRGTGSPGVGSAQAFEPGGAVAGAALVRYEYTLRSRVEGELVVVVRSDGVTLQLFVDAPAGQLDATRSTWEPLRDQVLGGFAGV